MPRSHFLSAVALSVALVILVGGVAQSQVELYWVVTGKGDQYRPFANDSYIAYTSWSRRTGYTAFARSIGGGTQIRLNADGTGGSVGGFDPGTNTVLYEQWTRRRSGLFFFDLDTGERTTASGVNSRSWEWDPRISSTFIVYALDRFRNGDYLDTSLKVFNRVSEDTRTLGTWDLDSDLMVPGTAGDRYVTYTVCTKRNCFAYIYDWATDTNTRVPSVNDKPQYAPVIDEANSTVYFTRSGRGCGKRVGIWRLPIPFSSQDVVSNIVDLPSGIDTGWQSSLTANTGTGQMDLYIERYECAVEDSDVYVAPGVDTVPAS